MSTYLEKDLHSVYIDNELPPAYTETYESLVQSDAQHAAELAKMKKLHDAFQADAQELEIDDQFLEASFARLETKLQYHKNAVAPQEEKPKIYQFARWGVSFAAAAAVFALIVTPVYLRTGNGAQENTISAIASTKLKPIAQNNIAVDGNFDQKTLSSIAVNDTPAIQGASTVSTATMANITGAYPQKTHTIELNDSLTSIDVFRPASANADNGFSIRINIAPMHGVQDEEIIIPLPNIATAQ